MNISNAGIITANSGCKIGIQGSTDGGNNRGIFMWDASDSNWGIYMASSTGGNTALSGTASAPAGNGFSSHALRFRCGNDVSNDFVWENHSNTALMSLRGNDGFLWSKGAFQTDNGVTINNTNGTLFFTDGTTTTCGICWADTNHGIFCKRNSDQMYFKEYGTCYFQTTGSNTRATLTSAGIVNTSDRRHKTDIRDIKFCGLDFINALKPKCFKLRESKRENCGFIAQDIEELVEKN